MPHDYFDIKDGHRLVDADKRPSMVLMTSTASCGASAVSGGSSARSRIVCIARSARFSWLLGMGIPLIV
jgi:hypothetical protein